MRYFILTLPLVILGGLLMFSQAQAISGEQLYQWQQIQAQLDAEQQMQEQQLITDQIREMQLLLAVRGYDLGLQQLTTDQIREIQLMLAVRGYDVGFDLSNDLVGTMSGVLDENTKAAIRQFQQDQGLAITSVPDVETLRALAPSSDQQEFFGLSPEFGSTDYTNENCCP
jgi:peptidoglycan hydrolase-like protein with peptidoglycan-binding domain